MPLDISSARSEKVHVHFNFDGAVVGPPTIVSSDPDQATAVVDGDNLGFFAVANAGLTVAGAVTFGLQQSTPAGVITDAVTYTITATVVSATGFGLTADPPEPQ